VQKGQRTALKTGFRSLNYPSFIQFLLISLFFWSTLALLLPEKHKTGGSL